MSGVLTLNLIGDYKMKTFVQDNMILGMKPLSGVHRFSVNGKISGNLAAIHEIENAVPIIVSPIGCGFHYKNNARSRNTSFPELECVNMTNEDVIFGSEAKLKKLILKVGDLIIVKVGETIPVDSVVIEGEGSLDISSLTGEYKPLFVKANDEALSGCTLKSGTLTLQVKKAYKDSTVSKILELVASSGERKAKAESFISKFAKYYTPAVLIISLIFMVIYA